MYADWNAVYQDNFFMIYRLMFRKVRNHQDAEDLAAEVFAAALRPLRLPAAEGEVRAYLLATSRTVLAGYWRRQSGQPVMVLAEDHDGDLPPPEAESAAPEHVARILDALPERYRRILQLRFLDACSTSEAARTLSISVTNAKVLQHRALRRAAEVAGPY